MIWRHKSEGLCVFNLALIFQNYFDSLKTKGPNCLPYLQAMNRGLQLAPRYFMNVITLKRCKNGQQSNEHIWNDETKIFHYSPPSKLTSSKNYEHQGIFNLHSMLFWHWPTTRFSITTLCFFSADRHKVIGLRLCVCPANIELLPNNETKMTIGWSRTSNLTIDWLIISLEVRFLKRVCLSSMLVNV